MELAEWSALDIAQMACGYHHRIVGEEVLWIEVIGLLVLYNTLAWLCPFLLYLKKFVLYDLPAQFSVCQNAVIVVDSTLQLVIFCMKLLLTKSCELSEAHLNDGLCLDFIKVKPIIKPSTI